MAEVTHAQWLATVRKYEGTQYHHQGRLPGIGMDCPAPLICGAWETGLKPRSFDVTGYPSNPNGMLRGLCDEHLEPIALSEAVAGDVLLTAWAREKMAPRHLGILTDATPGRMYWLQAENARYHMVRIVRLMFGTDGMHLVQAYRVPGVVS